MKKIFNICLVALLALASCDKVDDLPSYGEGTASVLTASAISVAPVPADSSNTVLRLNWTYSGHSTDSSNIKYTIEIDSVTKNFSNPFRRVVMGALTDTFTAKQLNSYLLDRGFAFNVPVSMEARLISSYANNNERIISNTLAISMTPYKVPPRVGLPAGSRLWANGAALPWSWTGAPPVESEFSRMNNETWGGIFDFSANNQFLVLSQNGGTDPYDKKYAVPSNQVPGISTSGSFGFYPPGTGGDNFVAPGSGGWYKMIMDFQTGTFTISSFGSNALPQELYILGDATAGGWNNAPPPAQKFTRINSAEFEITVALAGSGAYKFISSYGNWQPQFGGNAATGGTLGANYGGGSDPDAVPAQTAGNYKINVNFLTNKYTVTRL
ncbi:MAG: SusE domain-containing protein [Rhizobacter sp.]|nr:SusE domain-containing protein [Ferruginibacter sp.]